MTNIITFKKAIIWGNNGERIFRNGIIELSNAGTALVITKEARWVYSGTYTIKILKNES